MANTYYQIYLQAIFAVKYRQAVLRKSWRTQVFGVIGNLINETGCQTILVNGIEDHVHCLFKLRPTISVAELMKIVKAKSSKYINEQRLTPQRFEWQRGYGIFSYSQSSVKSVYHYIENQEMHHQKYTFLGEYQKFLEAFQIEYEDQYLFQDLE